MAHYLVELQAAVVALKPSIDAALTAAGLAPLMHMRADGGRPTNKRPLALVTLQGSRSVAHRFSPADNQETVPVTVTLRLDRPEPEGLAYETVLKRVLAGAGAALAVAVTDAKLTRWQVSGGSAGPDRERENAEAWVVTVTCQALIQW